MNSELPRVSKTRDAFEKARLEIDHAKHLIGHDEGAVLDIAMSAWKIQSYLEYAIALLKLHLRSEEEILRINKDIIPTEIVPMETIVETSNYLELALKRINDCDYAKCIAEARGARNTIRKLMLYYRKNRRL